VETGATENQVRGKGCTRVLRGGGFWNPVIAHRCKKKKRVLLQLAGPFASYNLHLQSNGQQNDQAVTLRIRIGFNNGLAKIYRFHTLLFGINRFTLYTMAPILVQERCFGQHSMQLLCKQIFDRNYQGVFSI